MKLKWDGVPKEHELIDSLSDSELEVFVSEAQAIKNSNYFKWFIEDLELLAERKMFDGDKDMLLFGKGILFCLHLMHKNVHNMASGKVKIDSKLKKKMRRFIK
tara:strand:- start:557 stop:865 length:309 start_codon:yes stop_codon:yes gene_type:complete